MERTLAIKTIEKEGGETVLLKGWVHNVRRVGEKLVFVLLRDRTEIVQTVFYKPNLDEVTAALVDEIRPEWVVELEGVIQKREGKQANAEMATGTVEIGATKLTVLNRAETPPFEINKDTAGINEELRMKYRYLDLRSKRVQNHIRLRSEFMRNCRQYLHTQDFTEVETPLLTQATPEGSRDFIVPSRMQPGKFFALPQSPQQYKQLLMTGGIERYFQFARAFRDEDLRADRGFEHTQIDLEMSFATQEDIMNLTEEMMIKSVEALGFTIKEKPFPRISYKDAMEKYGDDKFDLRTSEEKEAGVLAYAWVVDFPMFEKDEETGKWTFTHNPFSAPMPEHREDLLSGKNIENILASQYDLVCNGYESGGGSIRAHESEVLEATYKVMGYTKEETQSSVGHLLEAFKYGTPPHGGIALGVDRNMMNLTGEEAMREVVAFPMTISGNTSVMQAPTKLPQSVLDAVHIQAKKD
jgi:aspartyl-tRNA synthetase